MVVTDPEARKSTGLSPFISATPIHNKSNTGSSTLVYVNNAKGAPTEKRERQIDGPIIKLVRNFGDAQAPYFFYYYSLNEVGMMPRLVEKVMGSFWSPEESLGYKESKWDKVTGKVTNKYMQTVDS